MNWAFQNVFLKLDCFWRKQPRLGELGGNLLPLFPINRLKGVVLRIPDAPGFQLFWVKKIVFVKKIQVEVRP